MTATTTPGASAYGQMVALSEDEGLRHHFDDFANDAGISWRDFVAMLELEGVFDDLSGSDARHAAALTGITLTGFGPQALRYRAWQEETRAGGPIEDRPAFADSLRKVADLAALPRWSRKGDGPTDDSDPMNVFLYACGGVMEAWKNLPEPPAMPVLDPLYEALRTFAETMEAVLSG